MILFNNLKIRISIWYALLFMVLISASLLYSYKTISYQLKNEIISDLEIKTNIINTSFYKEEIKEHIEKESHDKEHEHNSEHRGHKRDSRKIIRKSREFNLEKARLITENTDKNYLVIVIKDDSLAYISDKYSSLYTNIVKLNIPGNSTFETEINNTPFSLLSIKKRLHGG